MRGIQSESIDYGAFLEKHLAMNPHDLEVWKKLFSHNRNLFFKEITLKSLCHFDTWVDYHFLFPHIFEIPLQNEQNHIQKDFESENVQMMQNKLLLQIQSCPNTSLSELLLQLSPLNESVWKSKTFFSSLRCLEWVRKISEESIENEFGNYENLQKKNILSSIYTKGGLLLNSILPFLPSTNPYVFKKTCEITLSYLHKKLDITIDEIEENQKSYREHMFYAIISAITKSLLQLSEVEILEDLRRCERFLVIFNFPLIIFFFVFYKF
jgi:hypothetical protein